MKKSGSLNNSLIDSNDMKYYFYESLTTITKRRNSVSSDNVIAYMVNLLCHYSHSNQLFDWDEKDGANLPLLAQLYENALITDEVNQRTMSLRRLGDVALFVAGLFSQSLSRKIVGIDYYINMGGNAYAWLSSYIERDASIAGNKVIFRELADRFSESVAILNEFADTSNWRSDNDLITLYELWLTNNDPRIATALQQQGVNISNVCNSASH